MCLRRVWMGTSNPSRGLHSAGSAAPVPMIRSQQRRQIGACGPQPRLHNPAPPGRRLDPRLPHRSKSTRLGVHMALTGPMSTGTVSVYRPRVHTQARRDCSSGYACACMPAGNWQPFASESDSRQHVPLPCVAGWKTVAPRWTGMWTPKTALLLPRSLATSKWHPRCSQRCLPVLLQRRCALLDVVAI